MMTVKKLKWHKIADSPETIDWQSNQMAIVEVGGKKITIIRNRDEITACAHNCPHAGGILAEGFIDAVGNVVCPLHRYKFSTKNGRNVSGEGYYLKAYTVEERADGIYIGLEETGWF